MNKFIRDQLLKCQVADIPEIKEGETSIIIPKSGGPLSLELNKTYLLELEDYIIHESENFNLSTNWNKGVIPKNKFLQAVYLGQQGKMMQFDAIGSNYDGTESYNDTYLGLWLPQKGFKIVRRLR